MPEVIETILIYGLILFIFFLLFRFADQIMTVIDYLSAPLGVLLHGKLGN